jgi:sarcosine oxidase
MGSAAAWALSRRGRSVAVFEAFEPGHRRGSSHGSSRIFRRAYPDPTYVDMTGRALRGWRLLEDEAGEPLLTTTGGLDHGRSRDPELIVAVLTAAGVRAELLPAAAATERWPGMVFDGPVAFHPEAGVLDPDRTIAAMLRLAATRGATVRHSTPIESIEVGRDEVRVHAGGSSWRASTVVVAVGAWLPEFPGGTGLATIPELTLPELTVTQQQVFHFGPRRPGGSWPIFIHKDAEHGVSVYGVLGGRDAGVAGAVKVGEHDGDSVTTASGRDGHIDPAARARVASYVQRWLPGLDPAPLSGLSCLYASTANQDFILDRRGPVVICSPCSGHGAKFAPLIGELVADLAAGRPAVPRFTLAAHLGGGGAVQRPMASAVVVDHAHRGDGQEPNR